MTQFQFTEWPCYSSPQTGALLHFRRVVADTLARFAIDGAVGKSVVLWDKL